MKIKPFIKKMAMHFYCQILISILCSSIIVAAPSTGQDIKKIYIDLEVQNVSVPQVFHIIQKKTLFSFVYNPTDIENLSKISIKIKRTSVYELLGLITQKTGLEFKQLNSNIAVSKIVEERKLYQQKKTVTGAVYDASSKEPLGGVNVVLQGTTSGVTSDVDGKFSIDFTDENYWIVFSYIGYKVEKIDARGQNHIEVFLQKEDKTLDEVVVVGYGSQKKINLTGAVEQLSGDALENRSASNVTQILQGVLPNLNIKLTDGRPYRTTTYNVRGTTSIGEGGDALILIDGVEGDPSLLNPDDIKSVSVLKDASSASVYGSRAAFGIILITTKTPLKNKISVSYTGTYSVKSPTTLPNLVTDGYTYAKNFYEAYRGWNDYAATPQNINKTMTFSTDWLDELKRRSELSASERSKLSDVEVGSNGRYRYYASTDWYKLLYKKNLSANTHSLSISGNNDKLDYLISGGLNNQEGLFRYNSDDYSRKNLRVKGSIKAFDWLTIDNNTEYSQMNYYMPMNVGEGNGIWRNIADEGHPVSPMFNPDGSLTYSAAYTVGDYWYGKNYMNFVQDVLKNTTGFTASFLKNKIHLKGDFTYSNNNNDYKRRRIQVPYSIYEGETAYVGTSYNDFTVKKIDKKYIATNFYGDYENTFARKHYVKGMLGYNYEQTVTDTLTNTRNGLLFEDAENLSMSIGESMSMSESYDKWRVVGCFFRLNYAYDDRYLLEVNGRYDGSSKFPTNQQWGFFPSISAGYRMSEEHFWKIPKNIISDVKFRVSYGTLGNGNVDPYKFTELFQISQSSRVLGGELPQVTSEPGVIPSGLTWEKSTTLNWGADLGFISGKLVLTGDIYTRKTTDMFTVGVTLPDVFGASEPYGNYADLTTHGFEISLIWKDNFKLAQKPFNYNIRATLADHYSIIDKYNNTTKLLSDYYVGKRLGEIWGYVTDGFYTSDDDISKAPTQSQIKATTSGSHLIGDIKFKDLNGDGEITYGQKTVSDPGDMKVIGNSEPRYIYSFNYDCSWNNISFSAFFQGVGKQDWYPSTESPFWGQYNRPYNNIPKYQLGKIWSEENPNTYFPRYRGYVAASSSRELGAKQTKYLQNVAYIRLKNIQLGYNISIPAMQKLHIQNARIYVSGENLWSWSPLYKLTRDIDVSSIYGSDSDLSSGTGGDGYNYPMLKSYTLGLSVTF